MGWGVGIVGVWVGCVGSAGGWVRSCGLPIKHSAMIGNEAKAVGDWKGTEMTAWK